MLCDLLTNVAGRYSFLKDMVNHELVKLPTSLQIF